MKKKHLDHLAIFLLRLGLALAFFYAAIAAFFDPFSWIGFFPNWMTTLIPGTILLMLWNIYELTLAVWLLSGWKAFPASVLASLTMLMIILPNLFSLDIVFRDLAILCAALALSALTYNPEK